MGLYEFEFMQLGNTSMDVELEFDHFEGDVKNEETKINCDQFVA